MPPPVENNAVQGQPQDLPYYADMGYYNMGNGHPPLYEHRDNAINNYEVALDAPAQAQAAQPAPVCTDLIIPDTCI